jgi:hypothetical protein
MTKQPAAGDNISAYCTKCKLTLDHAIIALVGETIAKVKCKTCGSQHKFKAAPAAPKPRKPRTATAKATAWQSALAEAKGNEKEYAMTAKFRVGDVVNHPNFGKGIVRKVSTCRCDILFQDRERLMVSANA